MEHYNVGQYAVLNKGDEYVFIRQITRFMPLYKRRLWMRFGFLDKVPFCHHLVLEVNPHAFLRLCDAYGFINKMWARLRANLFKKYGKFEFLRILEPHRSGFPHLHVLVTGIPFIDWKWLDGVWHEKYAGAGFVFRRDVGSSFNAVKYLLKYVNKMVWESGSVALPSDISHCTSGNEDRSVSESGVHVVHQGSVTPLTRFERLFSAILFASNKRLFSMSRGLLLLAGVRSVSKEPQGYRYLGSVEACQVEAYFKDKGLAVANFVRVKVEPQDLYDYSLVFFIQCDG